MCTRAKRVTHVIPREENDTELVLRRLNKAHKFAKSAEWLKKRLENNYDLSKDKRP